MDSIGHTMFRKYNQEGSGAQDSQGPGRPLETQTVKADIGEKTSGRLEKAKETSRATVKAMMNQYLLSVHWAPQPYIHGDSFEHS